MIKAELLIQRKRKRWGKVYVRRCPPKRHKTEEKNKAMFLIRADKSFNDDMIVNENANVHGVALSKSDEDCYSGFIHPICSPEQHSVFLIWAKRKGKWCVMTLFPMLEDCPSNIRGQWVTEIDEYSSKASFMRHVSLPKSAAVLPFEVKWEHFPICNEKGKLSSDVRISHVQSTFFQDYLVSKFPQEKNQLSSLFSFCHIFFENESSYRSIHFFKLKDYISRVHREICSATGQISALPRTSYQKLAFKRDIVSGLCKCLVQFAPGGIQSILEADLLPHSSEQRYAGRFMVDEFSRSSLMFNLELVCNRRDLLFMWQAILLHFNEINRKVSVNDDIMLQSEFNNLSLIINALNTSFMHGKEIISGCILAARNLKQSIRDEMDCLVFPLEISCHQKRILDSFQVIARNIWHPTSLAAVKKYPKTCSSLQIKKHLSMSQKWCRRLVITADAVFQLKLTDFWACFGNISDTSDYRDVKKPFTTAIDCVFVKGDIRFLPLVSDNSAIMRSTDVQMIEKHGNRNLNSLANLVASSSTEAEKEQDATAYPPSTEIPSTRVIPSYHINSIGILKSNGSSFSKGKSDLFLRAEANNQISPFRSVIKRCTNKHRDESAQENNSHNRPMLLQVHSTEPSVTQSLSAIASTGVCSNIIMGECSFVERNDTDKYRETESREIENSNILPNHFMVGDKKCEIDFPSHKDIRVPELGKNDGTETGVVMSLRTRILRKNTTPPAIRKTVSRNRNMKNNKVKKKAVRTSTLGYLNAWIEKRLQHGTSEMEHLLPFLHHAPRRIECYHCRNFVHPGKKVRCSVRNCCQIFHLACAETLSRHVSLKRMEFKCPQHECMICRGSNNLLYCVRCPVAIHRCCSPWPESLHVSFQQKKQVICWRHDEDWKLQNKHKERTDEIKEAFNRLPIPYYVEEFDVGKKFWKDMMENENDPPPYVHIRRNVFLTKRKRDDTDDGVGCSCDADAVVCSEDCVCRVQSMSCSKACNCSDLCTNKPFRKEKKLKIVKTEFCGWGAEAVEPIKKDEFIVEYAGEVINDALCEERLWEMKHKGVHNFYMCEIGKDFTIDATFKGNLSRFVNHSCDPNCKLEKWRVEGETRVGIFASKDINAGDALTYDYRFIQFGPNVKCRCGAATCRGDIGEPFGSAAFRKGNGRIAPSSEHCAWNTNAATSRSSKKQQSALQSDVNRSSVIGADKNINNQFAYYHDGERDKLLQTINPKSDCRLFPHWQGIDFQSSRNTSLKRKGRNSDGTCGYQLGRNFEHGVDLSKKVRKAKGTLIIRDVKLPAYFGHDQQVGLRKVKTDSKSSADHESTLRQFSHINTVNPGGRDKTEIGGNLRSWCPHDSIRNVPLMQNDCEGWSMDTTESRFLREAQQAESITGHDVINFEHWDPQICQQSNSKFNVTCEVQDTKIKVRELSKASQMKRRVSKMKHYPLFEDPNKSGRSRSVPILKTHSLKTISTESYRFSGNWERSAVKRPREKEYDIDIGQTTSNCASDIRRFKTIKMSSVSCLSSHVPNFLMTNCMENSQDTFNSNVGPSNRNEEGAVTAKKCRQIDRFFGTNKVRTLYPQLLDWACHRPRSLRIWRKCGNFAEG